MNRKWIALALTLGLIVVIGIGCGPKADPVTPDEPPIEEPPAPPATEVTPPPMPDTSDDVNPLEDLDLQATNEYIILHGLLDDVYFAFDKYDLGSQARNSLQKNAAFIRQYPGWTFGIEGHCDERGTNEYNLALGERRASAAAGYLASLGVNGSQLRTISYGEERPTCLEPNESCWGQNRRAHFLVTSKGN